MPMYCTTVFRLQIRGELFYRIIPRASSFWMILTQKNIYLLFLSSQQIEKFPVVLEIVNFVP